MSEHQPAAVLLRRQANEYRLEAQAVEKGLRPMITGPSVLRRLADDLDAAAEVLAPGFRGI